MKESEEGWKRRMEGVKSWGGKDKKDLGLHSRLGRPERTNVFDSPEMNFPAVVTTAAKFVKALPTVSRPQSQRQIEHETKTSGERVLRLANCGVPGEGFSLLH